MLLSTKYLSQVYKNVGIYIAIYWYILETISPHKIAGGRGSGDSEKVLTLQKNLIFSINLWTPTFFQSSTARQHCWGLIVSNKTRTDLSSNRGNALKRSDINIFCNIIHISSSRDPFLPDNLSGSYCLYIFIKI